MMTCPSEIYVSGMTPQQLSDLLEGKKKDGIEHGCAKPADLKSALKEVGLGRDKDGFFVYTHRARSKSYEDPHNIPAKDIEFIASTG
jgi:hypothetical protein